MNEATRSFAARMLFAFLGVAGCSPPTEDDGGAAQDFSGNASTATRSDKDESGTEGDEVVTNADLERGAVNTAGIEDPRSVKSGGDLPSKYLNVDSGKIIPPALRDNALRFYDANKSKLQNTRYVTVVDMAQHSKERRLFVIDMETGEVERHVVAHGKGSDPEHDGTPRIFSNVEGSQATSLGFYKTAETYQGSNGYSLRLDGLSSTNSNARARAIVVHGAAYVQDGSSKQGRSWGCPALPDTEYTGVIDKVKGGGLLYMDVSRAP